MRPHVSFSINSKTWKRLPEDIQAIMQEEALNIIEKGALEEVEVWNTQGIEKNVEKGMELMPFDDTLREEIKKTLRTKVIPDWLHRTKDRTVDGKSSEQLFNEIIAPLVGYKVGS
jgi:TRAP-type C4-dicarboxylate transport system substrate-binding protein